MLSLSSGSCCASSSSKSVNSKPFLNSFLSRAPSRRFPCRVLRFLKAGYSSGGDSNSNENSEAVTNYTGLRIEENVDINSGKLRLDSWISSRIVGISRARVQSSIRSGLVAVNGRIVHKVSQNVRGGDKVNCTIAELTPLRAEPEDIPLDIVYEDEHVLVLNKPAHMVVHPAPGNPTGTLVNGLLQHCSLPTAAVPDQEVISDGDDISDDEGLASRLGGASVRPGIVHRLDKGTSGLLVVAKDEHSHAHLSEQFKLHSIHRVYISLTCGVPSQLAGRIEIPIGRDLYNRIRMAAMPGTSGRGLARHAASRFKVIEMLGGGGSALVEWRLETGRTHQIRAHAKYMGIPLLGDEVYGGTTSMALSLLRPRARPCYHEQLSQLVSGLDRPCLHALALGFIHPHTAKKVNFTCPPPPDFSEVLCQLRKIGSEKAGRTQKVFQIYNPMRRLKCIPDTVTCNFLIDCHCRDENLDESIKVLNSMGKNGCIVNAKDWALEQCLQVLQGDSQGEMLETKLASLQDGPKILRQAGQLQKHA